MNNHNLKVLVGVLAIVALAAVLLALLFVLNPESNGFGPDASTQENGKADEENGNAPEAVEQPRQSQEQDPVPSLDEIQVRFHVPEPAANRLDSLEQVALFRSVHDEWAGVALQELYGTAGFSVDAASILQNEGASDLVAIAPEGFAARGFSLSLGADSELRVEEIAEPDWRALNEEAPYSIYDRSLEGIDVESNAITIALRPLVSAELDVAGYRGRPMPSVSDAFRAHLELDAPIQTVSQNNLVHPGEELSIPGDVSFNVVVAEDVFADARAFFEQGEEFEHDGLSFRGENVKETIVIQSRLGGVTIIRPIDPDGNPVPSSRVQLYGVGPAGEFDPEVEGIVVMQPLGFNPSFRLDADSFLSQRVDLTDAQIGEAVEVELELDQNILWGEVSLSEDATPDDYREVEIDLRGNPWPEQSVSVNGDGSFRIKLPEAPRDGGGLVYASHPDYTFAPERAFVSMRDPAPPRLVGVARALLTIDFEDRSMIDRPVNVIGVRKEAPTGDADLLRRGVGDPENLPLEIRVPRGFTYQPGVEASISTMIGKSSNWRNGGHRFGFNTTRAGKGQTACQSSLTESSTSPTPAGRLCMAAIALR